MLQGFFFFLKQSNYEKHPLLENCNDVQNNIKVIQKSNVAGVRSIFFYNFAND